MLLKNNRILPLLTAFVVLACVLASCVSTPSRPAESGVEAGTCGYVLDKQNRWYIGHAGIFIRRGPVWSYFEINGLNECQLPADETDIYNIPSKVWYKEIILSNGEETTFTDFFAVLFNYETYAGAIQRDFESKIDMLNYLYLRGYDTIIEFNTTPEQDELLYEKSVEEGIKYCLYDVFRNNCGMWARDILITPGSDIYVAKAKTPYGRIGPRGIDKMFRKEPRNSFVYYKLSEWLELFAPKKPES